MAYIRHMYMRHARFVIAGAGVTMRASNQPIHRRNRSEGGEPDGLPEHGGD